MISLALPGKAEPKRLIRPIRFYQLPTAKEVTRMVETRKGRVRDEDYDLVPQMGHQGDDQH